MRWRKMTWAIVIWTVLMLIWVISGLQSAGASGNTSTAYTAGVGIAITFLFGIWFVGFIILALIWFMSRPKANVVVFGPSGQQVMVSESEARRRVEREGWTYQAGATPSQTPAGGPSGWVDPSKK
jgi:hypothetical protein